MTDRPLSLFGRLWLGLVLLFRVVFDRDLAERARSLSEGPAPAPELPPPAPAVQAAELPNDPLDSARLLLRLLQRDGRLVDFLQQDITAFADAEVGAAARVVHSGCRRVLSAHAKLSALRRENEGVTLTLDAAEATQVKLVGDVGGKPPYRGVLRHRGWRLESLELPIRVGGRDAAIIAEPEVELG